MNIKAHRKFSNLYNFIRLVLGNNIPDCHIAHRWDLDEKNFYDFKIGKYPVPRLAKLEALGSMLDINKHLIFQVASGTPAKKVFDLIKTNDLAGQIKLLSNQLNEAHKAITKSEKRYRELFNNANDAIFIADTKTAILIDCNKQAESLLERPRNEIIGMPVDKIHPPTMKKYYRIFFRGHVKSGRINDLRKAVVITKNGNIKPVYISASVMELDGIKVIQGIFRDISNGVKGRL